MWSQINVLSPQGKKQTAFNSFDYCMKRLLSKHDISILAGNVPPPRLRHGAGEAAISSIFGQTEGTILLNILAGHRLLDLHHSKQGSVYIWTLAHVTWAEQEVRGQCPHRHSQVRICSSRDLTMDVCARSLPSQSTAGRQTLPRRRVGCIVCSALRGISK